MVTVRSVLAAALSLAACTPVQSPDNVEPRPYQSGDRLESTVLTREGSPVLTPGEGGDGPVVMTFLRPYPDRRGERGRMLIDLIDGAVTELRADVRARTTVVVAALPGEEGEGALPPIPEGWWVVDGPPEQLTGMASRLGVLVWDGTPGLPGQTFLTTVIDESGRLRHRFPGLVGWSRQDLVGAIIDADGR